jgi:hypothetical protein
MKHLLITSAMILAFFIGISKTKSMNTKDLDFVITEKGIFTPEDAKQALEGNFYTKNGDKLTIKFSDINSVIINGKQFQIQ